MNMSAIGLIEVSKVSTTHKPRVASGSKVVNPLNTKEVKVESISLQVEFIRTEEIKSFRNWGKSQEQEVIEGDFTIIYFKEDPLHVPKQKEKEDEEENFKARRKTTPTMLINENFRDFGKRLGAIALVDEEASEAKN